MASPAPGPAAEAPFNANEAASRASAAEGAIAQESPSSAPAAPSAPEQTQGVSPTPEQAAPAPTPETPTQDPSKWLLDKFGGDLAKASQWAIETNNRAAEFAQKLKAAGIDPQTGQPITTTQAPPAVLPDHPEAQVQIPEEQIVQSVKQYLSRDNDAQKLAATWNQYDQRLGQIDAQEQKVHAQLQRELLRLEIPEIAQDTFRQSEIKEQVRDLKQELYDLRTERRDLKTDQKTIEQQHRQIADFYRDNVKQYLTKAETQRQEETWFAQATEYHEQQFAQAWGQALDGAIKTHNIPPALVDDFRQAAKTYAQAVVNKDGEPGYIEDVPSFVANVGKVFMGQADKYHRIKSGEYGALATARGQIPGPNGSAAVAPPNQTTVPETVNDISRSARERLGHQWRALFGG